ncbi:MAG: tyrosine-type recombinase/integrase [Chromatocurvus sp.]
MKTATGNTFTSEIKKPCNKGRMCGQKRPLTLQKIWAIRIRLELAKNSRELALFKLAIESKLRARDLVQLRVADIAQGSRIKITSQHRPAKTQQPMQFEITSQTCESLEDWLVDKALSGRDCLFPSRKHKSAHLSTRQYARIVKRWVSSIPRSARCPA